MKRIALFFCCAAIIATFESCASMQMAKTIKGAKDPTASYIAFKLESATPVPGTLSSGTKNEPLLYFDYAPASFKAYPTITMNGAIKNCPYQLVKVTPGSYHVFDVRTQYTGGLVSYTTYRTIYKLPLEVRTIFRVRPGEIVYVGDYSYSSKTEDKITVDYDLDRCRAALETQNPFIAGFMWVSSLAERDSF